MMRHRWILLCRMIGARERAIERAYADLLLNYNEPNRYYHTLDHHIMRMLGEFDSVRQLAINQNALEMAIWMHDVKKSEEDSVKFAAAVLKEFGMNDSFKSVVAGLILATKHDKKLFDKDQQLIADLDLSGLGKSPEEFAADGERVRMEYMQSVSDEKAFNERRKGLLMSFLEKGFIYHTEYFKRRREDQAQINIRSLT